MLNTFFFKTSICNDRKNYCLVLEAARTSLYSKTDNEEKMSVIDPTFLVQPVFQDNQTADEEIFSFVEDLWLVKAVRVLESEHCYSTTL